MGRTREDRRAARAEYRAANRAQQELADRERAAGVTVETETYQAVNARTNDAANAVPWWRR